MIIDTHAHIYVQDFDTDRNEMLQRAKDASVEKILMPAIDSETHHAMLHEEKLNSGFCFSMMGVHPCSIKENYLDELKIARNFLEQRKFIAVGEIGLDFYWDKTFVKEQIAAFNEQIDWAMHYDIPISIHSRDAMDECIQIVGEHQKGNLRGVFHCFSGNAEQATKAINLGFYLGIGGVVTFKNSGLDKIITNVPMENILLETDAPYLAPVPYRGKRNEPAYLQNVIEKLSQIKNMSKEEIAEKATKNAERLFVC